MKKVYGAVAGEWKSLVIYGEQSHVKQELSAYRYGHQKKAYKTLEAAIAFCRRKQTPIEPCDKHIELKGFPGGADNYKDYLSRQRVAASAADPFQELRRLTEVTLLQQIKSTPKLLMLADNKGNSVAHLAAGLGYISVIRYLQQQGRVDSLNHAGETALHAAAAHFQPGVVHHFTQHPGSMDFHARTASATRVGNQFVTKESTALDYLGHLNQLSPSDRDRVAKLTLQFPSVTHGGVTLTLATNAAGKRYISDITFDTQAMRSIKPSIMHIPNHGAYCQNGRIQSVYEIRHKDSFIGLLPKMKERWVGKTISSIQASQTKHSRITVVNASSLARYIQHDIHDTINGSGNVFLGLKLENQAFAWLIVKLSQYRRSSSTEPMNAVPPDEYLGVFLLHASYKVLDESEFRRSGMRNPFFVISPSTYEKLYQLAHFDDPKHAFVSTDIHEHFRYWLKRSWAVEKLRFKAGKVNEKSPRIFQAPIRVKKYLDQLRPHDKTLREHYVSRTGQLQIYPRMYGYLMQRLPKLAGIVSQASTASSGRKTKASSLASSSVLIGTAKRSRRDKGIETKSAPAFSS